ncbi:hypothetical protein JYU29_06125 [Tianweitania sp. BSSL-BM11]|uniref:Uncharacterized protein n=1 Tax=Tianweitania aestuarii TaxID=2814886 RepID=A0ABS5RTH1_9HYPH|nr:hypothetical protein [Tianweitania aestuarii]MBS9720262.1 hypothetical protein [Tianweitania aestuarii]
MATGFPLVSRLKRYVLLRWSGAIPLHVLIVRDMLILGTLLNVVTTIASLIVLAAGAPVPLGFAVFLLPLPYNLFIFGCVWRSAGQVGGIWGNLSCILAAVWLVGATIL